MAAFKAQRRFRRGFSITDAIVAMLVVAIAVIGTITLRYQSSMDARRAEVGMIGSRLALMMVETWRGVAGSGTFDPVTSLSSDITIENSEGPTEPNGFTPQGTYKVQLNNVDYYTGLSYKDINADLRALNVQIEWEQKGAEQATADESDKSFALTVYVEK
jgi:hypothetical protein